jgi:putative oxidoreductase
LDKIKTILSSKIIQAASQLALGGIFVYAALPKIIDPVSFSTLIKGYRLIPAFIIPFIAYVLPTIEVVFGALLVLNIKPRLSASVLSFLLVIFIIAITTALIRGINIDCGCFIKKMMTPKLSRSDEILLVIRDVLFLIPGLIIIIYGGIFARPKAGNGNS